MERMVNQTLWFAIMGEKYQGLNDYFENDTFAVRPYSWTDFEDEDIDENGWIKEHKTPYDHDNSWHFWHKPSGLKVEWYKYPLRGCEANIDITNEMFYAVLEDSMNSTEERRCWQDKTYKEWWK